MVQIPLLVLPALLAAQGPDLTAKITLRLNATRLKPALERLSTVAGIPLLAAESLGDDVLVLNIAGASTEDVMKHIATVTASEWDQEGSGFRLVRSPRLARAEEEEERRRDADKFRQAVARLTKSAQAPLDRATASALVKRGMDLKSRLEADVDGPAAAAWEEVEKLRDSSPSARLLVRLLNLVDPARVASIPPNERRVFSTIPTRMQLPLGQGSQRCLDLFGLEQSHLAEAAELAGVRPGPEESEYGYMQEFLPSLSGAGPPAKALLILSRWSYSSSVSAELRVLGADGALIGSATQHLGQETDGQSYRKAIQRQDGDRPIELGEISKLLLSHLKALYAFSNSDSPFGRVGEMPSLPPALRTFFLNPEKFDPLQIVIGEGILQMASESRPNLIACLPDNMGSAGFGPSIEQVTLRQFEALLNLSEVVQVSKTEGWMEIRPSRPASARRMRLSRTALGKFLRTVESKGEVRLDDLAAFALSTSGLEFTEVASIGCALLTGDFASLPMLAANPDLLRLYATLSPGQRRSLTAGGNMTMAGLGANQRELVSKMVFFRTSELGEMGVQEDVVVAPGTEASAVQEAGPFAMRESTEQLPQGLPMDGVIRMAVKEASSLRVGGFWSDSSPDGIGSYLAMRERPDLFPAESGTLDLDKILVGRTIQYLFTFELSPTYSAQSSLSDTSFGSKVLYSLKTLPRDIRSQIEQARQQYRDSFKDMKQGETGGLRVGGSRPPPQSRP